MSMNTECLLVMELSNGSVSYEWTTPKYDDIHVYLTAIEFTPGGSSTSHIYTQIIHIIQRKENLISADRAPSLRVIPRHLPYN
jgi:hypothetical protein